MNWNNFDDTRECLESLVDDKGSADIFLIDNASAADEPGKLRGLNDQLKIAKLIFNDENYGFTAAHNKIFPSVIEKYQYVFLLNNDTVIHPELIETLLQHVRNEDTDLLSCKMVNYWKRNLMDNAGHKMLSSGEIIPIGHGKPIRNFDVSFKNMGACAGAGLYSSTMLKDIGIFDDYFKTGYEDAELGLRAFIAGYDCKYEPRAVVYHKMGRSIKKVFNYKYTLKIQTNIFYAYLKLVHWQVIAINFLPWLLRFIMITLVDIVFWRPKYLKVQYHALYIILFRDWKKAMRARKQNRHLRRISWWKLMRKQEFFLLRDIKSFYRFIIKGEKSYFEKYS